MEIIATIYICGLVVTFNSIKEDFLSDRLWQSIIWPITGLYLLLEEYRK